ncbi:response regulator transcription factor [Oceanospirillum linum]|uniref:Two-component system response regulator n=1 Tax=Oceanospirillum linum TaxID=966 RepID=A0A1T1H891_OCELI|nr:response regulator transcription factor [Oceanospirillum linum]OOV86081.1 two-component system response regulator [Oceanospirillum linum]SEG41605.1 DNA-binding response regulator, OmpR family, contains REC and winged-helix (wHTH) domain [Oleiphilus messinensis]SMP33548.1 DNA-binding response regulator, OmpR family, contains REC and winged-helix (wHTH) domain [Oceanospirillum linum]
MLILLIEDNRALAAHIIEYLELENVECDYTERGDQGLELAQQQSFDMIILDLNLPGLDGLSVCQQLREAGNQTPILMLTARDSLENKLQGFNLGADDYLTKPFDLPELAVRIKALTRRAVPQQSRLQLADLTLDLSLREASRQGQRLNLHPIGWDLLVALAKASPAPVSRRELERVIWQDAPPDSDALKSHLYQLRKVVNKPFATPLLHTLRNVGVVLRDNFDDQE